MVKIELLLTVISQSISYSHRNADSISCLLFRTCCKSKVRFKKLTQKRGRFVLETTEGQIHRGMGGLRIAGRLAAAVTVLTGLRQIFQWDVRSAGLASGIVLYSDS